MFHPQRIRYYDDDEFFDEGNQQREYCLKCPTTTATTPEPPPQETFIPPTTHTFRCNMATCRCSFATQHEYASHYAVQHRHRCETCSAVLPNLRLLEFHVQERHDSYFAALSARQPSYHCIVQSCPDTFWNKRERSRHLQATHLFPKYFCYDRQKCTRRQQQHQQQRKSKIKHRKSEPSAGEEDELVHMMSNTTISFGRNRTNNRQQQTHQHWSKQKNQKYEKKRATASGGAGGVGTTFGDLSKGGTGSTAGDVPTLNRRQRRALAREQQNKV